MSRLGMPFDFWHILVGGVLPDNFTRVFVDAVNFPFVNGLVIDRIDVPI